MNSGIDPAVVLHPERPNPTYPSHTAMSGRLAGAEAVSSKSTNSKISAVDLRGSAVILTLSEAVDKTMAENPKNYLVTINGGSHILPDGAVSYDAMTKRITLRDIPFRHQDHIGVTVLGLWDRMKNIPGPSVSCIARVPAWPHLRSTVLIVVAALAVLLATLLALLL
jgi:hypothetical protein